MRIEEFDKIYEQYTIDNGFTSTLPTPKEQFDRRPDENLSCLIFVHHSPISVVNVAVSSTGIVSVPGFIIKDYFA